MTRRTYTLEPQRLEPGKGYVPCEPHQAARVAILEISSFPAKSGRRPYRVTKLHSTFYGAAALNRARETLAGLVRRAESGKPKAKKIWGRSLTTAEYNAAIKAGTATPAVKWQFGLRGGRGQGHGRSE